MVNQFIKMTNFILITKYLNAVFLARLIDR